MRIIISDIDSGEIEIRCEQTFNDETPPGFQDVYSRLMAALDATTSRLLNEVTAKDPKAFRSHMYDVLDEGFSNFLKKVFPEINVGEFDLSAAAIVYAQDQIIQKAEAEGKTYHEMLDEYEAIADKYVQEKRLN